MLYLVEKKPIRNNSYYLINIEKEIKTSSMVPPINSIVVVQISIYLKANIFYNNIITIFIEKFKFFKIVKWNWQPLQIMYSHSV